MPEIVVNAGAFTSARSLRKLRLGLPAMFAFSLALTALPVCVHLLGQPAAFAVCILTAAGAALMFEEHAYVLILVANIFQNVFVTLISPNFSDIAEIEPIKIYSVITTGVIWAMTTYGFWLNRTSYSFFVRRLMYASTAIVVLAAVYFVIGIPINSRSATIYMRNISLPLLLLQSFLLIASKHNINAPRAIVIILYAVILCGYVELFANDIWLTITNGWYYLSLFYAQRLVSHQEIKSAADAGMVIASLSDYTSSELFNTPLLADWQIRVHRLSGPNFHPISFGYLLAILAAFAAVHGRRLPALLALPVLLMTNAKGPLLLAMFTVAFYEVARRRTDTLAMTGLAAALAAYAVFAFATGLSHGDFHVLGLLGGVNGFLQNPLGHSLGEGGNLSIDDFSSIDWSKFQHAGAADIAVESGVGVLLYQMGVASLAVIAFYVWLVWILWRLYAASRAPALAFAVGAVATTLVNGLFQEEAYFAPLALALALGLTGLSLGAADRRLRPRPSREGRPRRTDGTPFSGLAEGRG